ncbi:MAG TPA: hypothetical protein VFX60_11680 [Micromonospora sp.]|nr:hypothetical protein [Micromonospora sp.]
MSSVEEVKVQIAASVDQVGRAAATIRGASEQLDEALARLRLTAIGSAHPSILEAVARLEQARQRLDEAQTLTQGAADSADAYRIVA